MRKSLSGDLQEKYSASAAAEASAPKQAWAFVWLAAAALTLPFANGQGFSLIRSTGSGLSISADYCGRIQSACNYFATADRVMVSYVPIQGTSTFYGQFGEIFAWNCVIGFVVVLAMSSARLRKKIFAR